MSYRLPTPGRTFHLRTLWRVALLSNNPLCPTDSPSPDPTEVHEDDEYHIPNDRGALVQTGSTRLPLDRHLCASTLWSFFPLGVGCLAPVEATNLLFVRLNSLKQMVDRGYQRLLAKTRRNRHNLSYAASKEFSSSHTIVLWGMSSVIICETLYAIFALYSELEARGIPRPRGVQPGDWIQELQRKKAAEWIKRPEEHRLRAAVLYQLGSSAYDDRRYHDAAWYHLRALVELAPWWPTEYYLASWEAKLLQVRLFVWSLCALGKACGALGNCSMAYTFATTVTKHPFAEREVYKEAMVVQWACIDAERFTLSDFCDNEVLLDARSVLGGKRDDDRHPVQRIKSVNKLDNSLRIVEIASFASDFTPWDVVSFHYAKGAELYGCVSDSDDEDSDSSCSSHHPGCVCDEWALIQQAWDNGRHENPEPYCWTIEEEMEQLPARRL